MSKKYSVIAAAITSLGLAGMAAAQQAPLKVDANVLRNAGTSKDALPGNWLSYGRTQGETRYSPLKQIDASWPKQ